MRKINPDTLRKLNLSLSNPDLVKDVSPNELAEMVVVVLSQVKVIEQAIKDGRLNGTSPVEGKDFVGRSEATKMLTDAVNSAIAGFDSKMAQKGSQLEVQVQNALANIRSGDNGIVTEEEIGRAARMALELIELPDFEAMVQTEITTDGVAVRDALELLNGEDKLEQSAVKDLKEDLAKLWDEVQKKSAGNGVGGTSKPAVYRFIKDAIADGTITSGGGGGTVDVVSNVATDRILGRTTAGTGDSEQLTASEVRTLINVEDDSDKTDTANVTSAGALMDSEVTNLSQVKAFDSTDYATSAQGTTADSALQDVVDDTSPQLGGDLDVNGNNITSTAGLDIAIGASAGNDFTIDTNKFVVEGDTGNVGIGTTTPSQTLDIGAGSMALLTTTSAISGIIFKGADRFIHNFNLAGTVGFNTFVGITAGNFTMTGSTGSQGSYNTGIGQNALLSNTTGAYNTAIGQNALYANTTGPQNTAIGQNALYANTTGSSNTANGRNALYANTTGSSNTANGRNALYANTTGISNVATGYRALRFNTTGGSNVANGVDALYYNTTGNNNTALGLAAGQDVTTASNNTILGYNTGRGITTGSNNTIIGANVTGLAAGLANHIIIADGAGNQRLNITSTGNVGIGTTEPDTLLHNAGAYTQQPLSSDPADPDAGNSVQWVSDGTGTGDAGDVLLKVNVGGTTKVITLIDYSIA